MTPREPQCNDSVVFETALVRIGAFRCDRDYAAFSDTGPINHDCFVFPRTAVAIEHEHEPTFAANPNVVTFYNRGQHYLRHVISEEGDRCDWFSINRDVMREAIRGRGLPEHDNPFTWTRGNCDSQTYLQQRRIFELARTCSSVDISDSLRIEEQAVGLLESVLPQPRKSGPAIQPSTREMVHRAEILLSARFDQPLSLSEIAIASGASVFHLCRSFRRYTGLPLHSYLKRLRVRHGLERVVSKRSLSEVATDLGFAHHSHFTHAFRREFEATPSAIRAELISYEERC